MSTAEGPEPNAEPTAQPNPSPPSPPSSAPLSPLRRLDELIFTFEGALVSFAAATMVLTVTLDILFRALKGAQTAPLAQALTLWGLTETAPETSETSYLTPLLLTLVTFGFGWGVYASAHRGQEGTSESAQEGGSKSAIQRRALLVGALTTLGLFAFSVLVRSAPSWLVCTGLTLIAGGLLTARAHRGQQAQQAVGFAIGAALTAWFATKLPQGYIWSQELSLILLAWLAFVGGSMATYQQKHIEISALAKLIPAKLQPWVRPVSLAVTGLFSAYVCALLFEGAFGEKGSWASGEVRPATQIPTWVILLSGVVSFGMIALRSLAYRVALLRDPQALPEKEELH
jgi:TRAP-type C4-dicarboxylate transport system permease small subunit